MLVRSEPFERMRTPPVALGADEPSYTAKQREVVPAQYLARLRGARLFGAAGLVLLADGTVAAESGYEPHVLELEPAFTRRIPRRARSIGGDTCTLVGIWSNGRHWYHWFHETLLRLHGVAERVPAGTRYIVPARITPAQVETLAVLGIPERALLRFGGREVWAPERLWFPSLPAIDAAHPDALRWVREAFWRHAGITDDAPTRRLYISRSDTDHARVVDEAALLPVLERHGIEVVLPSTMTVTEQVRTFAAAELVVGPTGAGFTNLLFAGRTAKVLEVLEPRWAARKAFVIWALADALGQPFAHLLAETVEQPGRPDRADLSVDPERFEAALERWIARGADSR